MCLKRLEENRQLKSRMTAANISLEVKVIGEEACIQFYEGLMTEANDAFSRDDCQWFGECYKRIQTDFKNFLTMSGTGGSQFITALDKMQERLQSLSVLRKGASDLQQKYERLQKADSIFATRHSQLSRKTQLHVYKESLQKKAASTFSGGH